jgi:hypothetical protein
MLRAIATAKKKNEPIDASKIADCLRCDFLPESHMMPHAIRDRHRPLRYRHLLPHDQDRDQLLRNLCRRTKFG